jgi:hypothetical protein
MKKLYVKSRFGFREDTLENWTTKNPILEKGEPSIVSDPAKDGEWLKFGDGATPWNDLPYKMGPRGKSGVYIGSGDMPDDYDAQIDPNGEVFDIGSIAEAIDTKMDKFAEVTQDQTSTTIDNVGQLSLNSEYLSFWGKSGLILKSNLISFLANYIDVGNARFVNLPEPEDDSDAATKGYVDNIKIDVDQMFDAESENPQSGIAVAKAIEDAKENLVVNGMTPEQSQALLDLLQVVAFTENPTRQYKAFCEADIGVLQGKIQCFVSLFVFSFVIQTQIGEFSNVEFERGC